MQRCIRLFCLYCKIKTKQGKSLFFRKIYLLVSLSNFNLSTMQKWGILFILIYTLSACTYTEKIRDGKTAYERKQFTVANQLLTNEIKKVKTNAWCENLIQQLFCNDSTYILKNIKGGGVSGFWGTQKTTKTTKIPRTTTTTNTKTEKENNK